ncbi:MAG: hypothetical protein QXX17_01815 [Conexivisphaerales archaeon]
MRIYLNPSDIKVSGMHNEDKLLEYVERKKKGRRRRRGPYRKSAPVKG